MRYINDEVRTNPFELFQFGVLALELFEHQAQFSPGLVKFAGEDTELIPPGLVEMGLEVAISQLAGVANDVAEARRDVSRKNRGNYDRGQKRERGGRQYLASNRVDLPAY